MGRSASLFLVIFVALGAAAPERQFATRMGDILAGREVYYSTVTGIEWTGTDLVVRGTAGNKKALSGGTIGDIYLLVVNDGKDPECVIERTGEEDGAYAELYTRFAHRRSGMTGARFVLDWEKRKFRQSVRIANCDRNSSVASMLFAADVTLKKLIVGKKRIPAPKIHSFAWHALKHAEAGVEENDRFFYHRYETVFYLLPRNIVISRKLNAIEVKRVDFALVPKAEYEGWTGPAGSLEREWAGNFSKQFAAISQRVTELRVMTEAYKVYAMLRIAGDSVRLRGAVRKNAIPPGPAVPDSIFAMTFSELIQVPNPLINEPRRMRFLWLLMSGGVLFRSPGTNGVTVEE